MKFSVIIPTYNRSQELADCLASLEVQSTRPSELIIIDDGETSQALLEKWQTAFKILDINFVYYQKDHSRERQGLSESKNIALKIAQTDIVFILDDDLVLETDFLEKIMLVWQEKFSDEKLLGVGGLIKNSRPINLLEKVYNFLFGLSGSAPWDVNSLGFQVWEENLKIPTKVYYLSGGVASLRRQAALALGFTVFSGGRTALEDVDFCLRAKNQGYYFMMAPGAKVIHKQSPASREARFTMGFKETYNRRLIFRNNCAPTTKNKVRFTVANSAWILRQFLSGHFKKGQGMIAGWTCKLKD